MYNKLSNKWINELATKKPIQLTSNECNDIMGMLAYMEGYYKASKNILVNQCEDNQ